MSLLITVSMDTTDDHPGVEIFCVYLEKSCNLIGVTFSSDKSLRVSSVEISTDNPSDL